MKTYTLTVASTVLAVLATTGCGRAPITPTPVPSPQSLSAPLGDLTISGRVLDAGASDIGLGGVVVTASQFAVSRTTTTNEDGTFALEGLSPGEWMVFFQGAGYVEESMLVQLDESLFLTESLERDDTSLNDPIPLRKPAKRGSK